jgi:hypothetical protein
MHFIGVFVAVSIALFQSVLVMLGRNASQWTFSLINQQPVISNRSVLDGIFTQRVPTSVEPNWGEVMNVSLSSPVAQCMKHAWQRGEQTMPLGCVLRTHTSQSVTTVMDAVNPHLIILAIAWSNAIFAISQSLVKYPHVLKRWAYAKTMAAVGVLVLVAVIDAVCMYVTSNHIDAVLRYPSILVQLLVVLPSVYFAFKLDRLTDHHHLRATVAWKLSMHQQVICVPLVVTMFAAMGVRLWSTILAEALLLSVAVNILWALQMRLCERTIGIALSVMIPIGTVLGCLRSSVAGPLAGWREVTAAISVFALLPFILLSFGQHRIQHAALLFKIEFWCVTVTILACIMDLALVSLS